MSFKSIFTCSNFVEQKARANCIRKVFFYYFSCIYFGEVYIFLLFSTLVKYLKHDKANSNVIISNFVRISYYLFYSAVIYIICGNALFNYAQKFKLFNSSSRNYSGLEFL